MECSWNDGGKTQYYIVILDQLQGHSGGLVRALESRVRGPLTLFTKIRNDFGETLKRLLMLRVFLFFFLN